jgi:hypothetical protein
MNEKSPYVQDNFNQLAKNPREKIHRNDKPQCVEGLDCMKKNKPSSLHWENNFKT